MADTYPAIVPAFKVAPARDACIAPCWRMNSAKCSSVCPLYRSPPACVGSTNGRRPDATRKSRHQRNAVARRRTSPASWMRSCAAPR
eukprot:1835468-Pleurochrysis_carterae.AAC.1